MATLVCFGCLLFFLQGGFRTPRFLRFRVAAFWCWLATKDKGMDQRKKKLTSSYDRRSQNEIDWNRINTLNIWRSLKYSCLRLGHKKTPVDTNLFKHPVAAPRWSPVTDEPDGRTASGKPLGKSLVQKIFKVICQTLGDNTPRSVYIYIYI